MDLPLIDRVALVTGGATRIGRAIAMRLARAGCDIVIQYRSSANEAGEVAGAVRALGRQAWTVSADFLDDDAVQRLVDEAWEAAGWLDILVNNAAVYGRCPLLDADSADFDRFWRVNALAPMLLTQGFAQRMQESDAFPPEHLGHVVNLLDRQIASPQRDCLPYWVSKKALEAFTLGAAKELAPRIAVNGIAPGPVLPPATMHELAGELPLADRCAPADVARAAFYLCSSRSITGQILYVDSGQHLL